MIYFNVFTLLKYNLHTEKYTHLKCTADSFIVYAQMSSHQITAEHITRAPVSMPDPAVSTTLASYTVDLLSILNFI